MSDEEIAEAERIEAEQAKHTKHFLELRVEQGYLI